MTKVKIHIKDKIDFLKYYEKPKEENNLKECIFWREQKDAFGNETGKVEIKIATKDFYKDVIDELKKIKD